MSEMATDVLDDVRLLRPREAAEALGISIAQLDRLVQREVLRPIRLTQNGNRRFRVADLRALVEANQTEED
jgi:DNA-binding transcriptional MerR regulator